MASAAVRLRRNAIDITVSRDRGQSTLDFHEDRTHIDLDAVHCARISRTESRSKTIPAQVPDDVEWRSEVEACPRWIGTTEDAVTRVAETKRRRSEAFWG